MTGVQTCALPISNGDTNRLNDFRDREALYQLPKHAAYQTECETNRLTYRLMDTGRQTNRHRQACGQTGRCTDRQTGRRQTGRPTDRQTGRLTRGCMSYRQTGRQTHRRIDLGPAWSGGLTRACMSIACR